MFCHCCPWAEQKLIAWRPRGHGPPAAPQTSFSLPCSMIKDRCTLYKASVASAAVLGVLWQNIEASIECKKYGLPSIPFLQTFQITGCRDSISPLCGYYLFLFAKQDVSVKGTGTVRQVIKGDKAERKSPAVSSASDALHLVIQPRRGVASLTPKWLHS